MMKILTLGLLLASVLIVAAPGAAAYECTTTEVVPGTVSTTECTDSYSYGSCESGQDGYAYDYQGTSVIVTGVAAAGASNTEYCSSSSWGSFYTTWSQTAACAQANEVGIVCAYSVEYYQAYYDQEYQDCYLVFEHISTSSYGYHYVYPSDEVCAL